MKQRSVADVTLDHLQHDLESRCHLGHDGSDAN